MPAALFRRDDGVLVVHRRRPPFASQWVLPMIVVPFISQITTSPVTLLRQSKSILPSPLKSPTLITDQAELVSNLPPLAKAAPFICPIAVCPVLVFRLSKASTQPHCSSPYC